MFLPEAWGFWVTLHSAKDRDNMAMRYRGGASVNAFKTSAPFTSIFSAAEMA
jgi:hypothetical protein